AAPAGRGAGQSRRRGESSEGGRDQRRGVQRCWWRRTPGGIVAWASGGPGRDDDAPVDRELEGIYSPARVHGSGVGQLLLDAVIADSPAYLWVLDGNARAEAFYRRNGFRRDGAEREHAVAGIPRTTVRMVRS
ncbi:GNAT family N-acetyltransferase, partial [Corynebacterium variabile]|uniref:GNAT family N-acetyltransferase n=1 Tax=Corynebacterium variabile TaxID=1727 RepID=UPI0026498DAF